MRRLQAVAEQRRQKRHRAPRRRRERAGTRWDADDAHHALGRAQRKGRPFAGRFDQRVNGGGRAFSSDRRRNHLPAAADGGFDPEAIDA